ncbi:MAG: hypothetical protein AVDCRST_MAG15-2768, partial [uncultured Rubellimicrobium sp.]
ARRDRACARPGRSGGPPACLSGSRACLWAGNDVPDVVHSEQITGPGGCLL